jgi:fatty-acyl-CoA synthase
VGSPLAGQELAVLGGDGKPVPEKVEGEIAVRGPCVMSGYHADPEATRRAIDANGWLHSGDLGFMSQGQLFITGRKKDMVIKMGRNYYPSDVEGLIASFPELPRAAIAFASPNPTEGTEDLVVLVESAPLEPEAKKQLSTALNARLLAHLGIRVDKLVLVAPGDLSGADGRRAELRRRYLDGGLG